MLYHIKFFVLLGAVLFSCHTQKQATITQPVQYKHHIEGKVIKIADGDTFTLLLEKDHFQVRVRLVEIDAPEKKQPFSKKSKQYLSQLIFGKHVHVYYNKKDRYGRVLGDVYAGEKNAIHVNYEMVKNGYAWHFKKYSDNQELAQLENEARQKKRGLWADAQPIAPWDWRRRKK